MVQDPGPASPADPEQDFDADDGPTGMPVWGPVWKERSTGVRVGAALLLVLTAAVLSRILAAPLGGAVFLLYFPAVALSGVLFGLAPALLAVALSAVLVATLSMGDWPPSALEAERLLMFAIVAGGMAALGAALRADRLRVASREAELRRRTLALSERIKEQRCLYAVSAILARPDLTVDDALARVAREIPPGWCWPERTAARIQVAGHAHSAGRILAGAAVERRVIHDPEGEPGFVEVAVNPSPEGPTAHIPEELHLLDALADRLSEMLRRRAAEARLARSEAHFRSLVENITEVIVIVDGTGTNRYVSPSIRAMLGFTPEERMGRPMTELIHPDDRERVRAHLLGASPEPVEFRIRDAQGQWRVTEAVGSDLPESTGIEGGVMVVARDITERRELEERVQGAERMEAVGRLAGGVAQDFNNILTGIQGLTHLTLDELPQDVPAGLRANLREIDQASRRSADLVRQLLAFSRQQVLQPRVVDLSGTVHGMRGVLEQMLGAGLELRLDLAEEGTLVRVDPGQLEQMLVNLVVNARDAMPHGGTVVVRTAALSLSDRAAAAFDFRVEPGEYAMLTVADQGHGMEPGVQERVFEPFFTTKEKGRGAGLGLSTVYGIVKQSGGYVWVESEPGRGATFRVAFPRTKAVPADRPVPAQQRPGGGETVLLVEDDEAVRALGRRILVRGGYTVLEASQGEEALEILERGGVDVVLTDLVMPVMGGRELMARVRQRHPELPVLVMSGYAEDHRMRAEVEDSGDVFLAKPFTPEGLAAAVRSALAARPQSAL